MRTSHTYDIPSEPLADISLLHIEDTHITLVEVPSTPPAVPLVASSLQSLKAMSNDEESVAITNVDQKRQDDDHGQGCGRKHCHQEHERVHASPIELMVGHHGRLTQKRKALFYGTH